MASASIDAEPDSAHAMNFASAMPMFARNAAMMALPPPDALMASSLWGSVSGLENDGLGGRRRIVRATHVAHHLQHAVAELCGAFEVGRVARALESYLGHRAARRAVRVEHIPRLRHHLLRRGAAGT